MKIELVQADNLPRGQSACRLCVFDKLHDDCIKPEHKGCIAHSDYYYREVKEPRQYQLSSLESYTALIRDGGWRKTLDGRVLHAICTLGVCTRREVAYAMDIQASTISGAVNRLLKVGTLVTEESNPGDRPCKVSGRHTNLLRKHPSLGAT